MNRQIACNFFASVSVKLKSLKYLQFFNIPVLG